MSIRTAIYARYSSEHQREASIADQVRLCKERIAREGWTCSAVFCDAGISGATPLRPGYQALLAAVRAGEVDVVVAEALDRLSRDLEDVAALFKRLRFAGIRIVTLAEGEIGELDVGLRGTMNALYLKDLADKTRRGLRGRVEAGRSGGGNAYGYRVVPATQGGGVGSRGERAIDPAESTIVLRIFRDYAAGVSPKRIAMALNSEAIRAPRTASWSASTINGNRTRGTGILNNELYIGRLIWNRLSYIKDPETGRRRSRQNGAWQVTSVEVPHLRIVPQDLWEAVRARQAELDGRGIGAPSAARPGSAPFWSKQRPRYLFSGLMRCGVCGGGFSKISAVHFGCSTARNKGPMACSNLLTVRRDVLEETVLGTLREHLMDPDLFATFVAEFTAEWNRLQSVNAGDREARQVEVERVRRQIERLVDAIAEGTPAAMLRDRLSELETRRLALEAELNTAPAPAPRLHPNLAAVYRQRIASLTEVLAAEDAAEAREHRARSGGSGHARAG